MYAGVLEALGGLGLLLLGLLVMTQGLRALAGEHLQRALSRFTHSPVSGAMTGAVATAIVQSSSAVTVATVGFVSAGVLAFSDALGIIFGANIGTTVTGWLVALLGLKLDIEPVMMVLLLSGALIRLFGRGRFADGGWALAGFALVFAGIARLKAGMEPLEGLVTPESFPPDTLSGRALLVLIGIAITLVTQSSSAGIATALTAVHVGSLSFQQAAAMVIGMDVGTTVTTALATVGGAPRTKRTGYSHVIYNLMTGVGALLLLDPYIAVADWWWPAGGAVANAEFALVGFHTTFNTVGVLAILPFTRAFGRLMERIVPERGPLLTRRLDSKLVGDARSAVPALARTVEELADVAAATAAGILSPERAKSRLPSLEEQAEAIERSLTFAQRLTSGPENPRTKSAHIACLHALDHLGRFVSRLQRAERAATVLADETLRVLARDLAALLTALDEAGTTEAFRSSNEALGDLREPYRERTMIAVTAGALSGDIGIAKLDAMRWLHRLSYHAWRTVHHVRAARIYDLREGPEPQPLEPEFAGGRGGR